MLGVVIGQLQDEFDYGVIVIFIDLFNIKLELFYFLGDDSLIRGFLEKNFLGGIYYMCFEVEDILFVCDCLKVEGVCVLGSGELKIGVYGKLVLFLYFKDFNGCLIELEQV